jgi:2-polyprenyl-3-methyl-5-hydroxy-6-metoxy-1,4-benzoquinol methylase
VRRWAEVGVGTGLYTRLALQGLPESHGVGYDISPLSLRFTAQHVAAFGCDTRYTVRDQNILTDPPSTPVEAVLCIEVLEHLEDPVAMLRGLRAMVQPGGMLFVTAALNAGHADHIYLYREPADVLQQAAQAELHVEHCFFANAYAPAAPGIPVPSALAMVLRREA